MIELVGFEMELGIPQKYPKWQTPEGVTYPNDIPTPPPPN